MINQGSSERPGGKSQHWKPSQRYQTRMKECNHLTKQLTEATCVFDGHQKNKCCRQQLRWRPLFDGYLTTQHERACRSYKMRKTTWVSAIWLLKREPDLPTHQQSLIFSNEACFWHKILLRACAHHTSTHVLQNAPLFHGYLTHLVDLDHNFKKFLYLNAGSSFCCPIFIHWYPIDSIDC